MGNDPHTQLHSEVAREIAQVAHRGRAGQVKELVLSGSRAYEEESYADAFAAAVKAKELAPRSASVRELLGLACYRLGRWREAARELAAYRRLSGRHDQDHVYADCERALERPERALEIVEEALREDLDDEIRIEALIVGAGALGDMGRYDDAVRLLERGPVRPKVVVPYHLRLWYALADALDRAGRRPEARPWWDVIYAEDPEFFDVASRRLGVRRG